MANAQQAKVLLRQSLLQQRQALSRPEWQQRSQRLAQHLQTYLAQQPAKVVLAYISTRQEPDLSAVFTELSHLIWGLPRCQGQALCWHLWSSTQPQPLVRGKYNILEPAPDWPTLAPAQVDLILVPAVACDHQGYRLGYGGGYYDRLLAQPAWQNIPTVGIVFDFAYLPHLPHANWDIPLGAVCTEAGLFLCPEKGLA
jgi:5-formyltetrahydrofolate cyclo-ligase